MATRNNKVFFASRTGISLCATFFCSLALLLACADAHAQSSRWKLTGRVAQSPSMRQYLSNLPQKDIDLYVGKIVRKDGEFVIVNVMSPSTVKDRVPMYYACNAQMQPTAILQNMKISHRACATFKTVSGTAIVGDTVMVKYFAPNRESAK